MLSKNGDVSVSFTMQGGRPSSISGRSKSSGIKSPIPPTPLPKPVITKQQPVNDNYVRQSVKVETSPERDVMSKDETRTRHHKKHHKRHKHRNDNSDDRGEVAVDAARRDGPKVSELWPKHWGGKYLDNIV